MNSSSQAEEKKPEDKEVLSIHSFRNCTSGSSLCSIDRKSKMVLIGGIAVIIIVWVTAVIAAGFIATNAINSSTNTDSPSICNVSLVAIKDVWLEREATNYNNYDYLIIGKHPGYHKKRSLLQFKNLPSNCACTKIISAKMYIWYWYSHKASWQSDEKAPHLNHTLKVHQVKKEWIESQATSLYRKSGVSWSQPYLGLDGTDADANYIDSVYFPNPPPTSDDDRWIEFDITEAAQKWANGQPNYGVVVWSNRENDNGRDVRFYSRERSSNKPYMRISCDG